MDILMNENILVVCVVIGFLAARNIIIDLNINSAFSRGEVGQMYALCEHTTMRQNQT